MLLLPRLWPYRSSLTNVKMLVGAVCAQSVLNYLISNADLKKKVFISILCSSVLVEIAICDCFMIHCIALFCLVSLANLFRNIMFKSSMLMTMTGPR